MDDFNYGRVELARKRRGLTKTQLAEAVGVSTRSLTKYEREARLPSPVTIERFARVLNFPTAFFHGEALDEPPLEGVSFRSMSGMTARQRDQARGSGTLALRLSDWIDARFDLPAPEVPRFPHVDPETAAEAVREAWGLGQRPISNMVHLLESRGVRVFSLAEECREVDAFSFWRGSVPYIFLNTMKTIEHSRMDAAHELGHLVMHAHGGPEGREAENEAQAFGAAFLMPAATVLAEVPYGARVRQIVKLKGRWKVSAFNLARRAHKLGLLTEWQYRSICIALTKRGKANEPNPLRRRETSQVIAKVFAALRREGITKAAIALDLHLPLEELNTSLFGLEALTPHEGGKEEPPETNREKPTLRIV